MSALFQYQFLRHALAAALLASLACGVVGSYVVVKKLVFISGGISHAVFGGLGLAYFFGLHPMIGVIPFSLLAAWGIGGISRRSRVSEDAAIGVLWAVGMALGVVLISLRPGYAPDLFGYLFGNILTVGRPDLAVMALLNGAIIVATVVFYRDFLALCFDEEFARVVGVRTGLIYNLLLALIAVTVVILIRVVGVILVIALFTIPASIARRLTSSLKLMMALAAVLAFLFTLGGLWISWTADLPAGAATVLLAGAVFGCFGLAQSFFSTFR